MFAVVAALVLLATCGDGDGEATTLPTVAINTTSTTDATDVRVTTAASRRFPPEVPRLRHGDDVFGVYLAVERSPTAPELARTKEELGKAGYPVSEGFTDIACDRGAHEALGLAPGVDYVGVVVYFRTRQEAQQFVDAFEPGVVGTAQVTVFCLDSGY